MTGRAEATPLAPNRWLQMGEGPHQVPFEYLDVAGLAQAAKVCRAWRADVDDVLQQKFERGPIPLALLAREIHALGRPYSTVLPSISAIAERYFSRTGVTQLLGNREPRSFEGAGVLAGHIYESRAIGLMALFSALHHSQIQAGLKKISALPSHQKVGALLAFARNSNFNGVNSLDLCTDDQNWFEIHPVQGRLINHVPGAISRFPNLVHLGIENNGLLFTAEDVEILARLPLLVSLSLSSNRILQLPSNIHLLRGLRSLDVSHNRLKEVPGELAGLEDLQVLNLHGNPFTEIPLCFQVMSSLTEIRLSNTQIKWAALSNFIEGSAFNLREPLRIIVDGKFLAPSYHARIHGLARKVFPHAHLDVVIMDNTHSATFVLKKHLVPLQQTCGVESAKKKRRVDPRFSV